MKRCLFYAFGVLLLVPMGILAQAPPSLATPQSPSGTTQQIGPVQARTNPNADILLVPDERRDLEFVQFIIATCIEEGVCPTFSMLKNVPDQNVVLFDEEYEEHKTRKQVWRDTTPANGTSGKWRAFLDGAGIPDPPDNTVLTHVAVFIGVDGTDSTIAVDVNTVPVDVNTVPSDPEPFLIITFNRNMYVREIMQNLSLASLRGEDFLDRWRALTRDPQWKEREAHCMPADEKCEQGERIRMELLGRIVTSSATDQKAQTLFYGDRTHEAGSHYLQTYHRCANRGTMPEELVIAASIGDTPLDNLRGTLATEGVAPETAEQWARFAERGAHRHKTEIERLVNHLAQEGVSEEDARAQAVQQVIEDMRRDLKPLAKSPGISACASLLWDLERKFYMAFFEASDTLSRNAPYELSIRPSNLTPYLEQEQGNVKNAVRNYLRNKMKTQYEPRAGPKAALYHEHWKDHK